MVAWGAGEKGKSDSGAVLSYSGSTFHRVIKVRTVKDALAAGGRG